ncbi:uncharacterized protein B0I36DRAFT_434228 [Microdochium trichocladiopsis]|uniref:NADH:flavin oxidoreductase/NADH oxidase N-terminal domain-containing protein n=1 Tax=Microdochium trichocladiopsis TaxID=1682393 RepID=A0A9P8Y0C3_9PEZI|nr:uncharacterized protein B0I36DRAFT_434228 [Microdochium trichocladiopsis]KAH7024516.1 hypothetical protein B0I36DRAFT_434228 [Microdochium trichocladiopsis]
MAHQKSTVGTPLKLSCGLVLKNRLVKTAMSEKMAVGGKPTSAHGRLYAKWAQGGWAALITGNIMVDDRYTGGEGDVAVPSTAAWREETLHTWTAWAQAGAKDGCHMIAQLNHPGRQSPAGAGKRSWFAKTIAPSAIPLNLGDTCIARVASAIVFGTPREMTQADIDDIVAKFASAAHLAAQAGFQGVEIHAGHGFLLSQFLSSTSNRRQDAYGGTPEKRARLVLEVIRAVRTQVPAPSFCIGVKINTADFQANPYAYQDMLCQIALLRDEKVDYVNLSGGTYEDPTMLSTTHSEPPSSSPSAPSGSSKSNEDSASATRKPRDAFFLQASKDVRVQFPDLPIILTGGFRSSTGINTALEDGACSAVGIGRPAVKYPDLPNKILGLHSFSGGISVDGGKDEHFEVESAPGGSGMLAKMIRSVGAGAESKYWAEVMRRI